MESVSGEVGSQAICLTELQSFYATLEAACATAVVDAHSQISLRHIFALLKSAMPQRSTSGSQLPVCRHVSAALATARKSENLRPLVDVFSALEPHLVWKPRASSGPHASANFAVSHANAMIAGPGGLEERDDLWLGVSLLAPHVRYPDHTHPPEETYLVLSEGDFMQWADNWFTPGIGGSFYNPPGILHAMRSGETPLLAIWALLPDQVAR